MIASSHTRGRDWARTLVLAANTCVDLCRCKLPIEEDNATFPLPDGIWRNYSFPNEKCERYDVNYTNYEEYLEGGKIGNKSISCDHGYVYDTSKYESSAFIEVGRLFLEKSTASFL